MTRSLRPRVGVTVGDPAGIGPEIALKAVEDAQVRAVCEPVLYGPSTADELAAYAPGQITAAAGRVSYDAVGRAVADAMAGRLDGLTTGPIHKEAWALAGFKWRGHTELLAHLTGTDHVAMLFEAPRLRVVLLTVHVPLAEVSGLLTRERVDRVLALVADELPAFGVSHPRLAVAGLNPHAGEGGLLGDEERFVLTPAILAARDCGVDVTGPLPADTVFRQAVEGRYDVVVACYHDQGLIPVKLAAFGEAVNVTLGLPIVRTSVDHGTAFDIARQGVADAGSLVRAVVLAARLARSRRIGRDRPAMGAL